MALVHLDLAARVFDLATDAYALRCGHASWRLNYMSDPALQPLLCRQIAGRMPGHYLAIRHQCSRRAGLQQCADPRVLHCVVRQQCCDFRLKGVCGVGGVFHGVACSGGQLAPWGRRGGSPLRRSDRVSVALKERDGGCDVTRRKCRLFGRCAGQFSGQSPVEPGITLGQIPEGGAERVGDDAHGCVVRWCPLIVHHIVTAAA